MKLPQMGQLHFLLFLLAVVVSRLSQCDVQFNKWSRSCTTRCLQHGLFMNLMAFVLRLAYQNVNQHE
jgi:hypothetical protein